MSILVAAWTITFEGALSVWAADAPRRVDLGPDVTVVRTLAQHWNDEEADWFYNVAQGSQLLPYDWFLHLEQAGSTTKFRDAANIRALGYIPRTPDAKNPDGLPVGFVGDVEPPAKSTSLGFNCAACHTGVIRRGSTALLIDGAPTLGDFERFMRDLASALKTTADDDAKFNRFAAAVLPPDAGAPAKDSLRAHLRDVAAFRAGYNQRNLPAAGMPHFGPGRVDAFGAIFNEVSVTFLDVTDNQRPATAPVSYPCLWDAPQHERVQWNGAAENKENALIGPRLFGTRYFGALGRNSGEVLGVFGSVEVSTNLPAPWKRYESTVNYKNLIRIEDSLRGLWSPQWPEDVFGALDAAARGRGQAVYAQTCIGCHEIIDRTSATRSVRFQTSNGGTDPTLNENFLRTVKTGRLKGRRKTLVGLERFGSEAPTTEVLKHVVERVILTPNINLLNLGVDVHAAIAEFTSRVDLDAFNPGFRVTAEVEVGGRRLVVDADSFSFRNSKLVARGARYLEDRPDAPLAERRTWRDLHTVGAIRDLATRLDGRAASLPDSPGSTAAAVELEATAFKLGYKSRPLNGVWATAPYLHNGAVPSLAELLKRPGERSRTFRPGGREFDPEIVGFKDDLTQQEFDTTTPGNSNAGHSYGTELPENQKRDLLEYLKSL